MVTKFVSSPIACGTVLKSKMQLTEMRYCQKQSPSACWKLEQLSAGADKTELKAMVGCYLPRRIKLRAARVDERIPATVENVYNRAKKSIVGLDLQSLNG
jgi:hypothetical protein